MKWVVYSVARGCRTNVILYSDRITTGWNIHSVKWCRWDGKFNLNANMLIDLGIFIKLSAPMKLNIISLRLSLFMLSTWPRGTHDIYIYDHFLLFWCDCIVFFHLAKVIDVHFWCFIKWRTPKMTSKWIHVTEREVRYVSKFQFNSSASMQSLKLLLLVDILYWELQCQLFWWNDKRLLVSMWFRHSNQKWHVCANKIEKCCLWISVCIVFLVT